MIIEYIISLAVLFYTFIGFFTYNLGTIIQQDLLTNFVWSLASLLWVLGLRFDRNNLIYSGNILMILSQGSYFALGLFSKQIGPIIFTTASTAIAGVFFAASLYSLYRRYQNSKIIVSSEITTTPIN